ncbi:MAG TPA: type III pantothenate kinase, partial [Gammaproteobacteria bacterium]|nr:type III pantothenate kinase [Gammaproteobacteria bacterium]
MKLLLDIGNSQVKYAFLDSGKLTPSQAFPRSKTGIKASLTSQFKQCPHSVESVVIANVAGDKIGQQCSEWIEKKWQITPQFIHSERRRFGVTNSYEQPNLLGVDRWLALIAARQHARVATCVIDCGTAITVDIVTKYGQHQGGMIFPGLTLMRNSLLTNAANITENGPDWSFKTLAMNTESAVQSGTLYTISAALERLISDLKMQYKGRIRFIITGGDALTIKPMIEDKIAHYPDIVLKGLAYYARQRNKPEDDNTDPEEELETETET